MKKSKGIVSLVLIAALLGLLGFTCWQGFGSSHTGSARNINLGLDLAGGVSITYQTKDKNPSAEDMKDTIYKLQKRVEQYSTEASVYQEGMTGSTSRSRVYPMLIKFWKNLANQDHWYFRMQMAIPFLKEQMLKMQRLRHRRTLRLRTKNMS